MHQPIKIGCQPVAMAVEQGKLLSKEITSSHPREIAVKHQQKVT